nr:MAG TPA: hypothetical protein [Caudoviricetes sp.]
MAPFRASRKACPVGWVLKMSLGVRGRHPHLKEEEL